ncbi:phosphate signaling complex protein PhoU [Lutispora thermophila]|uniref:Phosphate-specific transport system accessory protein PhoU n=1 Tax=Lutispora thermophila DSM 19022 TaxID=1122184 RepID=A0A1M6CQ13_9FIRM|nr:phosphate signaling complex protein PhoU [Lutispora thermophila]SHI62884.1 phosphate uptake regulator, PhoU [Lutispora thermophila DSM 19022]
MTRNHFDNELQELIKDMIKMSSIVEEALTDSINALKKQDIELADKVIAQDDLVDKMELEIEDKCLKLIALQQPIAKDLRIIATALKIVTDLERIADHAVDIAKITKRLSGEKYIKELIDIPRMAYIVTGMVKDSIDAYVKQDVDKAREVSKRDDEVDGLHSQIFRELLILMMEDPRKINQSTYFLFISQSIERIADHVTNICEWIIYAVTGEHVYLNE